MANHRHRRLISVISVESPILLFVSDSVNSLSLEQRKELLRFKDELTRVCTQHKQQKSYYQPAVNDLVAVYYSEDECWERGRIQCVFQTFSSVMYKVFLIDEGTSVSVDVTKICQLPDAFSYLPPQVYKIGLYGVLPINYFADSAEKPTKEWSSLNRKFVEEILFDADYVYFENVIDIHGICFGNVIIENASKLLDLRATLYKDEIVKESPDFVRDITNYYGWGENKDSYRGEKNSNECSGLSILKELDVKKTSISAIKDIVKRANQKRKENELAVSSLPRQEEDKQKPSTSYSIERGSTTRYVRPTASDDSFTNDDCVQKVHRKSDILYVPHGCTVDNDLLKKKEVESSVRRTARSLEGFHRRRGFGKSHNRADVNWTETVNRGDTDWTESKNNNMYKDKRNFNVGNHSYSSHGNGGRRSLTGDDVNKNHFDRRKPAEGVDKRSKSHMYVPKSYQQSHRTVGRDLVKKRRVDNTSTKEETQNNTYRDKSNFSAPNYSRSSPGRSNQSSSSGDINKNTLISNKPHMNEEERNKSSSSVPISKQQESCRNRSEIITQTVKSTDCVGPSPNHNLIESQKNGTKIESTDTEDVNKSVNSEPVGTDVTSSPIDVKSMSRLSVREMMNLLRQNAQAKKISETSSLCSDQREHKETVKTDTQSDKISENKKPQLNHLLQDSTDNVCKRSEKRSVENHPYNTGSHSAEIRNSLSGNVVGLSVADAIKEEMEGMLVSSTENRNQSDISRSSSMSDTKVQQNSLDNKTNSVSNNTASHAVKQDDWPIFDKNVVTDKRLMEELFNVKRRSCPSSVSSLSVSSESKENLVHDVSSSTVKHKQRKSADPTYFSYVKKIPILLHGDSFEPIVSISDMTQDHNIFQCLQKWKLRDLSRVQRYACPVISARRDAVIVSSPRSGKSLSYIVPILGLLRNKSYYSKLLPGSGPRAVFLVSCSTSGEQLYNICKELVEPLQDIKVCLTYGGGAELEVKEQLINGCDILISTPRCLLRLLEVPFLTSLKRVCHVVLDEADILLQNFLDELTELMSKLNKVKLSQGRAVQTVIVSNTWNLTLEDLVRQVLQKPVICIAAYLEAAIYSRVKPVVSILKPDQKICRLLEFLKSEPNRNLKTVILCNRKEEVQFVKQSLEGAGITPLAAHEGIDFMYSESVITSYWATAAPVVVCSDSVLPELNITDAQCLIHFGLPETKKQFGFRFSCLLESYRNILKPEDKPKCEICIFVDEENENQFPEIMKFMERLGTSVPPVLEEIVKRINIQKEKSKGNVDICENIKEFGKCWDVNKCPYRHTLNSELDQPKNMPVSGRVKLQILHVHNACHYSARILEHSVLDTWTQVPSDYMNLVMEINNYYSDENNRCLHGIPTVGDIAAVETFINIYERAQVLKITKYNYKDEPSAVVCKLLDSGAIREYDVVKLFHLPERFQKHRLEAVDVYLCRLLPVDLDQNWSSAAKTAVEEWVAQIQKQQTNSFIIGKIVLNIADNLWLDPLEHMKWLALSKTYLSQMSFHQKLLKVHLAVENKKHLDTLFELCREADIDIPYYKAKKSPAKEDNQAVIKCQWAHLPRDEYTAVRMHIAYSLDMIFVRVVKFEDRLHLLQKDIQAAVNKKMEKLSFPSLKKEDVCLGKFSDDEWYRAQVVEDPTELDVKLFFVDYGDYETVTWDCVYAVPAEIISRLPFQAIECTLAGVIPIEEEENNAVDLLYDMTEDPDSSLSKIVFAKVCNIDLKAQKTGGRRYSVVLVDKQNEEDIVLNKDFVLKGFGNWHPKEKQFLNNLPPVVIEESDNSEHETSECSEVSDNEDSNNKLKRETTTTTTDLVPKNSTPQRSQEEVDKIFEYVMKGLQNGDFDYISPDVDFLKQHEESTTVEREHPLVTQQKQNGRPLIQEVSEDDIVTEVNGCVENTVKHLKALYSRETRDKLGDVCNKTKQTDSVDVELQQERPNPSKMEDTDSAVEKLNSSYGEVKQPNTINKELQREESDPGEKKAVETTVELNNHYNEMKQTDIIYSQLEVEKSDLMKGEDIESTVEEVNVVCNEMQHAKIIGKELQIEESDPQNMEGTCSSEKDLGESSLHYINKAEHSDNITDESLEKELNTDSSDTRKRTGAIEKDLHVDDSRDLSSNRIYQFDDVCEQFSDDALNTSSNEGKRSKSDSLSSSQTSKENSSQLGLAVKLQAWFFDHMKTADSSETQTENGVNETVIPPLETEHEERRRKLSDIANKTIDTGEKSQDIDITEGSNASCKKSTADTLSHDVSDEESLLSESIVEVSDTKRRSLIQMLQGWLLGDKGKLDDTQGTEILVSDNHHSPNGSLSELCNDLNLGTEGADEHDITQGSLLTEEQCDQQAVSPDNKLCTDRSYAIAETSTLPTSFDEHLNNSQPQTKKSEQSTAEDILSEMEPSLSEQEVIHKQFISFLKSCNAKDKQLSNDENCSQNETMITNTSQSQHEDLCTDNNQNNDSSVVFALETAASQILEADSEQGPHGKVLCDKELCDGDGSQKDESVVQPEENASGSALQTSSSPSVTKEENVCEHSTKTERLHDIFITPHDNEEIDIKLVPPLVEKGSFRPQVMWHQDSCFVWLHILLHDVKKYKLLWSAREIYFRTVHQGRVYSFKMYLFGAMDPELLTHSAKGFHVEVKLVKTVQGYDWRRLLKTEVKQPWVKINLEAQAEKFCSDSDDGATGSKNDEEPDYVPSSGRDGTAYDREMYDDSDTSSSGSDVYEFESKDNYDPE